MMNRGYRFTEGALIEDTKDGWVYGYVLWPTSGDLFGHGFSAWTWHLRAPGRPIKHEPEWRLLDREGGLAIWIDNLAILRYRVFSEYLDYIPLGIRSFAGLFNASDQFPELYLACHLAFWCVVEKLQPTSRDCM